MRKILFVFTCAFVMLLSACATEEQGTPCKPDPVKPFQWITQADNNYYAPNVPINFSSNASLSIDRSAIDRPTCYYYAVSITEPGVGRATGGISLNNNVLGNGLDGHTRPIFSGTMYSSDGNWTLPIYADFDGP